MPVDFNSVSMNERTNYLPQYENFKTYKTGHADTQSGKIWFELLNFEFQTKPDKAGEDNQKINSFELVGLVNDIFANNIRATGTLRLDIWRDNSANFICGLTLDPTTPSAFDPNKLFKFALFYKPMGDAAGTYDVHLYVCVLQNYAACCLQLLSFDELTGMSRGDWKYNGRVTKYIRLKALMDGIQQTGLTDSDVDQQFTGYTKVTTNDDWLISSANNDSVINIGMNTKRINVGSAGGGQKTVGQIVPPEGYANKPDGQRIVIYNFNNVILQNGTDLNSTADNKLIMPGGKAYQMANGEAVELERIGSAWIKVG